MKPGKHSIPAGVSRTGLVRRISRILVPMLALPLLLGGVAGAQTYGDPVNSPTFTHDLHVHICGVLDDRRVNCGIPGIETRTPPRATTVGASGSAGTTTRTSASGSAASQTAGSAGTGGGSGDQGGGGEFGDEGQPGQSGAS